MEGLMANVPRDMFRNAGTYKKLLTIEEQLKAFAKAGAVDNHMTMLASYNDLAAQAARWAGREDVAKDFEAKRDEFIQEAAAVVEERRRRPAEDTFMFKRGQLAEENKRRRKDGLKALTMKQFLEQLGEK